MIEMLGVLAIIGVLSVGGIYGYTTAMRKYKANEVAQTVSMLATLAHAANGGYGGQVTLTNSGLEKTPGGVDLTESGMTADCKKKGGAGADKDDLADACATVTVTLGDFDEEVKKAVCQIVPKDGDAVTRAGYQVTDCDA